MYYDWFFSLGQVDCLQRDHDSSSDRDGAQLWGEDKGGKSDAV